MSSIICLVSAYSRACRSPSSVVEDRATRASANAAGCPPGPTMSSRTARLPASVSPRLWIDASWITNTARPDAPPGKILSCAICVSACAGGTGACAATSSPCATAWSSTSRVATFSRIGRR